MRIAYTSKYGTPKIEEVGVCTRDGTSLRFWESPTAQGRLVTYYNAATIDEAKKVYNLLLQQGYLDLDKLSTVEHLQ